MIRRAALILAAALLLALPLATSQPDPVHEAQCAADPAKCQVESAAASPLMEAKPDVEAPLVPKVSKPDLLDKIQESIGDAVGAVGDAAGAVGRAIGNTVGALADAVTAVFAAVGRVAIATVAFLVAVFQFLVYPLAEFFLAKKPAGMPTVAYAAAASGATAVAAGGAQASLYALWKKFGLLLGLVPGFSRIAKDELLDHDRRAKIFEMIKQNPGIRLSELANGLELPWGSAMHHLRKLRAERLIMFKAVGAHKCYFINGSGLSEHEMAAASLLKGDTLQNIATFLTGNPGSSLKDVAKGVGISSPLAAFHVSKLERAGLIEKVREGRSVRLQLAGPIPQPMPGAHEALGAPNVTAPTAS